MCHIKFGLCSSMRIEGIFAYILQVLLMPHPFFENKVVFNSRLLLVYSSWVYFITNILHSCFIFSSCFFFYWRNKAWSSDLTNSLDLGKVILGRYLMIDAILTQTIVTCWRARCCCAISRWSFRLCEWLFTVSRDGRLSEKRWLEVLETIRSIFNLLQFSELTSTFFLVQFLGNDLVSHHIVLVHHS